MVYMEKRILIIHGGAPTAVINSSLYGAVMEGRKHGAKVLGALGGAMGLIREDLLRLDTLQDETLRLLPKTPASAIGTSRDHLNTEDYLEMAAVLKKQGISYVLFNGGNGSMEACGKLQQACKDTDIRIVGIPKTVDNDIAVTDHAPGFGSAARYLAGTVQEIAEDVRSLPIHVCVIEAMGRNAGWLAAASSLARREDEDGPHIILCPERPFAEESFLEKVDRLHRRQGGVVVVCSEGLRDEQGNPIVEPVFQVGRSVYYGDVSAHLANLIISRLGVKARSEKPGICGRASIAWQSEVDCQEAKLAGREAVRAAMAGETGVMVGLERLPGLEYSVRTTLIPIDQVMLHERTLPLSYITSDGMNVTSKLTDWCRPLVGELPDFFRV